MPLCRLLKNQMKHKAKHPAMAKHQVMVRHQVGKTPDNGETPAEQKNGFFYDETTQTWSLYQNDVLQSDFTGFYEGTINTITAWYYVENGFVDLERSGFIQAKRNDDTTENWCYVKDGQLQTDYTDVVKVGNEWWYVKMVLSQLPAQLLHRMKTVGGTSKMVKLILTTTVLHKTKMAGGIFVTVKLILTETM